VDKRTTTEQRKCPRCNSQDGTGRSLKPETGRSDGTSGGLPPTRTMRAPLVSPVAARFRARGVPIPTFIPTAGGRPRIGRDNAGTSSLQDTCADAGERPFGIYDPFELEGTEHIQQLVVSRAPVSGLPDGAVTSAAAPGAAGSGPLHRLGPKACARGRSMTASRSQVEKVF
jgi:hypothetical protein